MKPKPKEQLIANALDSKNSHLFHMRWITFSVLVINLFVIVTISTSLRSSRHQYEQRTSIAAQSLAQILDKNVAAEIDKIELILLTAADEFESRTRIGNIDENQFNTFLTRQQVRLNSIESLRIADEEGQIRYGNSASPTKINISDRRYFIRPRDNPDAGLSISNPVVSRISKKWVLPLSLRLNKPDGSFAGVVYANIELAFFSRIFSVINVGPNGGISLRDDQMGIIARYPTPKDISSIIGNNTLSPELRKLFESGNISGTFFTPTSWDNVAKVVSYRKIADYPLYVNVGIATEDYLSGWWKETLIILALSAIFFFLTLFSARLIYRYMIALEKTADALRESREGLEQKVEERTSQLGLANKALQEGHSRLITVLNSIDAIVYVADMETYELLFINEYIKSRFEYILGKKCWQTLYPGQDGPCEFCTNSKLIGPDGKPTGVYRWEYQSSTHEKWYDCRDRAILWIDGKLKRFQIATDITEYRRVEAEKAGIEAQNWQLQKAESLGRMAGAIAHHFNNQLQVVLGNLEIAMADLSSENSPNYLTDAIYAAHKAVEVSSLMLTYLGQIPGRHQPLDLSEVCRRSLPLLVAAAPKDMLFKTDFPSSGPVIRADSNQMQQVLTNLVTNAWEAANENEGSIGLSIKTVFLADIPSSHRFPFDWHPEDIIYACLEISDTGSGISNKDIEKIFDPFFTTKFVGRGLGLSVVIGIVKTHGGGVTVESSPDSGSVFRVYVPVST
ncbi:MAG: ATP-binding protein [Desulfocapsaceae bacterium]|nr:ATP-binding protein [Desulfocapsaceae bacterium]